MRKTLLKLKSIAYILSAFTLGFFLSGNGENFQGMKNSAVITEVKENKAHQTVVFLTYIDSIVKLPDARFNMPGIWSLNKIFLSELPLVMHEHAKEESRQNILLQYYENKKASLEVESGIVFLIPEALTDSLVVADFTDYFGSIENEKRLMGVTAQPLPVYIRVTPKRKIKLTFKNNENQDQAGLTAVEVVNYR